MLFVGVALRNGLSWLTGYEPFDRAVSVVGNVSLALFLAMALMTLRLWELAHLALPVLAILVAQTALMAVWVVKVTYPAMGAHLRRGGAGRRPVRFRPGRDAHRHRQHAGRHQPLRPLPVAFVIVPLVGAFFLDLANAVVIKAFLSVLA